MGTRREKILQKLNPKLLKKTPKLSGDAGSFIDLDCDNSLEDGAKNLMMRFFRNQDLCEKNKRNPEQNVVELKISSAKRNDNNEICELISEKLYLPFSAVDEDDACEKPGKRLQKLKMELQEKMSAKWEEEYKKRVKDNKVGYESKNKNPKTYSDDDDGGDGDDEDGDSDDEDGDSDDDIGKDSVDDSDNQSDIEEILEVEDDESKDATENTYKKKYDNESDCEEEFETEVASVAGDKQSNGNSCEDKQENKNEKADEFDDGDSCSLVPAYQPGGGMLYGGSELTQYDDGLPQNLLSPSLRFSMNESGSKSSQCPNDSTPKKAELSPMEESNNSLIKSNKLFSYVPSDPCDLSEAFEFCSGKFPDADEQCELQLTNKNENFSSKAKIQGSDNDDNENEDGNDVCEVEFGNSLEDLEDDEVPADDCSERETSKTRRNIIAFEDSDAEEEEEIEKDMKLDEVEESQSAGLKILSDDEEEDRVEMKNKMRKNLYFSDEEDAEGGCEEENDNDNSDLSEKEDDDIGDDCEERSVNYDSEENEIINPKEFFEKEAELSGEEWSGDEDERGLDEFDVEEGDADKLDDDQVRSQLEKIHIRRVLDDDAREVRLIQEILFEDGDLHSDGKKRDRKFKWKNLGAFDDTGGEGELKEEGGNSSEEDCAEEEELRKMRHEKELFLMTKKKDGDLSSDEEIVEDFHSIKVTSVKSSIKVSARSENASESVKVITDYTTLTKTTNLSNTRGSFLTRNEEFLSRLAKVTSSATDNVLGHKSSKNFVFATKSPEKANPDKTAAYKRQVEDSENYSGRGKKIKLFPPEIDTGPSILDLLV